MDVDSLRRLTNAALGVVLQHTRDLELEQTRLDLERARMEREDFRNGGGPCTRFMHDDRTDPLYEKMYKYRILYPRAEYQKTARSTLKNCMSVCDRLQRDYELVMPPVARLARGGHFCPQGAKELLDELQFSSVEVEETADDGRGPMNLSLAWDV